MNTSENSDSVCIRGKQSVLFGNLIVFRFKRTTLFPKSGDAV